MARPRYLRPCAPYKRTWVGFPDGFLHDKEVTFLLKGFMAVLCSFLDPNTGIGSPTYRALEAASGCKKRWLNRLSNALVALGYLEVEERTGTGLEYYLKGGPLRMDLATEGGGLADHPPGGLADHPMIIDDDLIRFLKNRHGLGAADAAAVAAAMSPDRLRELLTYVEANPPAHADRYILAAAAKERRKPARRPPAEQLPLKSPGELEQRRAAAPVTAVPRRARPG